MKRKDLKRLIKRVVSEQQELNEMFVCTSDQECQDATGDSRTRCDIGAGECYVLGGNPPDGPSRTTGTGGRGLQNRGLEIGGGSGFVNQQGTSDRLATFNKRNRQIGESDLRRLIRRVSTKSPTTESIKRAIKSVINETPSTGCHIFKGRGVWPSQTTICTGGSPHKIFSHTMDNNQWYSFLGNPSIGDKVRFTRADGGPPPEWVLEYLGTDCSERIGLVPAPNGPAVPCGQGPTGGCDTTAWSGYNTWVSNWTNGGAFNSQNTNQPCTHICKQINTWTNNLTNAGTTQANQLNCKVDEGNNQSQINGCNC